MRLRPRRNMPGTATIMAITIMVIMIMVITTMVLTTITGIMIMSRTSMAMRTTIITATRMIMAMPTTIMITHAAAIMTTTTATSMADEAGVGDGLPGAIDAPALYRLQTWLSPAFPVGGFSYSSGIEWAVEAGDVVNAATLRDWLAAMLDHGSGFCDGIFLAHAHRAAAAGDMVVLAEVADLAAAFVPSRERRLETLAQGRAFADTVRAAWSNAALDRAFDACIDVAYPVAVGVASAAHRIPLPAAIHAFLHALTSNWISAGVRLIPLGQTDSQRVLAALEPVVARTAAGAREAALDDLGGATFRADLAGMRHETQYTRLFRS